MQVKKPKGIAVPEQTKLKLSDVNMAVYNPRVMPPEKMAALKASLLKHGFVLNLVVQKRGTVLIGGHQRVTAMREICAERGWPEPDELPSTVLDVDDATAKQLNIALNNVEGEFDPYKLGEIFADIFPKMTGDDVLATGFAQENIAELIALVAPVDDAAALLEEQAGELTGFASSVTLTVEFETVEQRDQAKELLKAAAGKGGKPGTFLLRAMRAAKASGRHDGGNNGHDRRAGSGKKERAAGAVRGA
jgi:ParB-like chromosome segregation protein Spo0J